jgi:3-isopropylmalate/(R)-2-methylmalate dehydratase large subunit
MTLVEKILAAHCGKEKVSPGEFINARVDVVMANDVTAPISIREFRRIGVSKVFDPGKIVLVPDHFTPNKDITSAENSKMMREFAHEQGTIYFEVGQMCGIEHALLPEQGLVLPGEVIIGGDSHTCTYGALSAFATGMGSTDIAATMATGDTWIKVPPTIKLVYHGRLGKWVGGKDLIIYTIGQIGVDGALYAAIEFTGETIDELSMDGRLTMANMTIEAGGKAGLFSFDDKTKNYLENRARHSYTVYEPDADAEYARVIEFDVSALEPQVALPGSPANARPVSEVKNVEINQAVIGSCTNGRLEDLRVAASILKDKKVDPKVRCLVFPATQQIYLDALAEGLLETFVRAGAAVNTPSCGPCAGLHMGILAEGERCISTTNRNFVSRMGSPKSEVYLSNPAVAAASAVMGRIASPEEVV